MGQPVTLFCSYTQEENRTTNNCLAILKMLYNESPKFFADALAQLIGVELGVHDDVEFQQQERNCASTPDGLIRHPAFTIFLETKTFERFDPQQLENHLSALNDENAGFSGLIVLTNFEGDEPKRFQEVHDACKGRFPKIIVRRVGFQQFFWAVDRQGLPKYLKSAVQDFQQYLAQVNLFSRSDRLFYAEDCPDPSRVLSTNAHIFRVADAEEDRRCRFFGLCQGGYVRQIAVIEACVGIWENKPPSLIWQNVPGEEREFIAKARSKSDELRPGQSPIRIFLLGPFVETKFREYIDYPASRSIYFDVEQFGKSSAEELADAVDGMLYFGKSRQWVSEEAWQKGFEAPEARPWR